MVHFPRTVLVALLTFVLVNSVAAEESWFMAKGEIRMEFLLEEAPAAQVVEELARRYNWVKFSDHPTMNGFYAQGSRHDLLEIKREIAQLDRLPGPPPPPLREFLPLEYGDLGEVRALLSELIPNVSYTLDSKHGRIIAEGSPGDIDIVRELLCELSRDGIDQVMVDLKLTKLTPKALQSLEIQRTGTLLRSTVVIRENGRVIHTYSEPVRARFTSVSGHGK